MANTKLEEENEELKEKNTKLEADKKKLEADKKKLEADKKKLEADKKLDKFATIRLVIALFIIVSMVVIALHFMTTWLPELGVDEEPRLPLLVLFGVIISVGALIVVAVLLFFKVSGNGTENDKKWYRNISKDNSATIWRLIALSIIGIIEFIAIYFIITCLPEMEAQNEVLRLPLLVLFGVIAFLGALTIAAAVLHFFKLSNPLEALGLPSGSVRALIALSLILIFAMMVIFMATNLGGPSRFDIPVNSTVIYGDKNVTATNGTITILVDPSEAAIDFSKQVLTTVSTLVVALAGFYFGTKAVAQAQQTEPKVKIILDPKSPYTLKTGENSAKITVDADPGDEVVKAEIRGDDGKKGSIVKLNDCEFEYTPPSPPHDVITVDVDFYLQKYPSDKKTWRITSPKKPP